MRQGRHINISLLVVLNLCLITFACSTYFKHTSYSQDFQYGWPSTTFTLPGYTESMPSTGMISTDLNNDGREDLVATYAKEQMLFVMINAPGGNFTPIQNFTVGPWTGGIRADDINGDGWKDLLVANSNSGDVSVLLARGQGYFNKPYSVPVGGEPYDLLTTDLDQDGNPDLVVALCDGHAIDIRYGKGDGTFGPNNYYQLGNWVCGVTAGDVNNDGRIDLLVTESYHGDLFIMLNDGARNFTILDPIAGISGGIKPADLNHDGNLDFVCISTDSQRYIKVYYGAGDATFSLQQTIFATGFGHGLRLIDMDNDGDLDLFSEDPGGLAIAFFYNNGSGYFLEPVFFGIPYRGYPVLFHFDDDPYLDLAICGSRDHIPQITISRGLPDRLLALPTVYHSPTTGWKVEFADYNLDGHVDFAASFRSSSRLIIFYGNGESSFHQLADQKLKGEEIATADFNGDGITDIASLFEAALYDYRLRIYINKGDSFDIAAEYKVDDATWRMRSGRFNDDSYPDLVIASLDSDSIQLFLGRGDGTFLPGQPLVLGGRPEYLISHDFNRDGFDDIMVANEDLNIVTLHLGNASGLLDNTQIVGEFNDPIKLWYGDFNGDGATDIIVKQYYASDGTTILYGDDQGHFTESGIYLPKYVDNLVVTKLNDDNRDDFLAHNAVDNTVERTFLTAHGFKVTESATCPKDIYAYDYTADGRLDIISTDYGEGYVWALPQHAIDIPNTPTLALSALLLSILLLSLLMVHILPSPHKRYKGGQ